MNDASTETRAERAMRLISTRPRAGCSQLLGLVPLAFDPEAGTARIGYTAKPEFCNPMGVVQGGFLTAMIDEAMALAVVSAADFTIYVPTLELKVSFLNSGWPGPMVAEGRVVRLGTSIAFLEGKLFNGKDELIATATATAKVIPRARIDAARKARGETAPGLPE
ncbi:MAG: PaaI family thioesterase [Pseudomonadota bacterium]|nr:PaaI family thioesterase [Pseudomonadota bacterium]